jgi:hypothetical protein
MVALPLGERTTAPVTGGIMPGGGEELAIGGVRDEGAAQVIVGGDRGSLPAAGVADVLREGLRG